MIVPVRCFSCGRMIGEEFEEFSKRVEKKEDPEKVLDSLGISRYCCRRTILGHVDLIDEVIKYKF